MEKPIIIHLSSALTWRGGENQISILMNELAKRNWPQLLVTPKGSPLFLWANSHGFNCVTYTKTGSVSLQASIQLSRICKKTPNAILHIHDSHAHNMAYFSAKLLGLNTQWILTRRILHNNKKKGVSTAKYNHPSLKHIIAVSSAVKDSIFPSIKLTPIHVIPDSIQVQLPQKSFNIKNVLPIPAQDKIIGYAAAITPEKDHLTFLKVANCLLDHTPNLSFIILGDNSKVPRVILNFLNNHSNLALKVHFTGFQPDPIQFMSQWDICLSTSISEGLGSALLECMSLNIPVVSTQNGGISDWIKHDYNGLLAPIGDVEQLTHQTIRLLTNPELKEKIVKNAKSTIDQYGPTQMADKYQEIYQSMVYLSDI